MKFFTCILFLSFIIKLYSQGSCSSPITDINIFTTASDANNAASAQTPLPKQHVVTPNIGSSNTIKCYYSVTSSSDGTLGFLQTISPTCKDGFISSDPNTGCLYANGSTTTSADLLSCSATIRATRDAQLFPDGSTCSGTGNIPYDVKIKNSSYSTTFNPEWTSLSPSTKYVLVVTLTLSDDCKLNYVALSQYSPPPPTCNASIGNLNTTKLSGSGTEYEVGKGDVWSLSHSNFILPPDGNGGSFMGYLVYTCKPPTTIDITNPSAGVASGCFKGTSKTATDENINGASKIFPGITELWIVPVTFDTDISLADGKDRIDEDLDGCYDIGSAIHVKYLSTVIPPTPPTPCGTCSTPNCPIGNVPTYADRFPKSPKDPTVTCDPASFNCPGQGAQNCNSGLSVTGTYKTYQIVKADPNGFLGAYVQGSVLDPSSSTSTYTITSNLYSQTNCGTSPISTLKFGTGIGTNNNAYNRSGSQGSWNPEWSNLTPNGTYILETTFNIPSGIVLKEYCMDYYGKVPPPPVYQCQTVDFEVQKAGVKLTNLTFSCSDDKVELVALDPPSSAIPDKWIYPGFILYIKPQIGTVWGSTNKIDLLFNGTSVFSVDVLADLTSANLTNTDDYIFPVTFAQAGTFSFKLNGVGATSTKKFDYIVFNAADGTVADQGVLDKNKIVTLAKGPVGTAKFTGPGVTDDPDNAGKGFFDPKVAGAGTHKILYSWDNGTAGTTNCKGTKEITVTVTGGPTVTGPTTICEGTTVEWTSTAPLTSSDNTFVTIASSGANKYNITALKPTTSTTNLKLTATSGGCSAVRDVTIIPKPSITGNLTLCADATSQLTGSGTAATTTPWVSATTTNATISNAGLVTAATAGNGTSEITYTDNNGCIAKSTVTVNPILQPTVTCGTSTATSVTFSWGTVAGATSYDLVYNKDNTSNQTVPGHTLLSYPVSSVPAGKSVTLIVTPKGTTGCFKASVVKTCTADNCPSPTITQDPVNTSKCVGEGASFSVTASSTATLSYKWQINNGSNPPTDITDAGVYSGASTSSLTISDVTGLNGLKYQCLVTETTSGTNCNKTSVAATLTVNPLPTFIPTALDICEGETPVITYPSLTGNPDKIIFDPGLTGVTPINLTLTASPFKITGLTLPVNTYTGLKVKLENSTTGCKSSDITIPAFKVQATQKPSISSKSTSVNSVTFQWSDLTGLNTQTGTTKDSYTVKEFICTGCTTPGSYVPGTGTLSYNASTSKWEYLRNVTNPGDKVFIEVTPVDVAPLATPSCFAASTYDLLAITCTSPIITKDIIDVSLCEGTSATPIPASFELEYNTADATTPVTWEILKPGTTWTTLNPTGVYSISGSTNVDSKLLISDIKGLDGTKYRANIKTATPGGSCNTISYEALLTVKPLPTITPITDKSFCPVTIVNDPLKTTKDIEFKVSQYGTPTFSWVSDVQTTGVSSGQSNVNSFASFTTLSPSSEASSKITVTPTLNGCVGSPIDFKVIVKPKIKPIFSTPSASDITYSSVKFNWNSSISTITPDEWKVDTISVLENASDPLPTSYFSVSPNRTSSQNFYTYNVKSGKKAFIIVTPISTGSSLFCADTARKYLIPIACVTPTKPLTPIANPVCEGSALDLTGVLTDATADFQWKISTDGGTVWNNVSGTDFGSTGTTNVLSTSTTKSYMNNAIVKLVLTDKLSGQCTVESDKVTLAINPLPTVNLIQPSKLSLCVDDPEVAATVQPLIGKTPMKIDYTLNSVTSSNQDIANLEIKFSTKEDKIHSLTIDKVIDANGCESLLTGISSSVTINKNPTPDFIVSDTIGCIPLNVVFTDNSGIVYKDVTWDFGTGSNSSKDKGSSNYSFQKAGDFTITYSVEDNQGCKAQIIKTDIIHAKNTPIASISTDRNIVNIYENEVRFDSKLSQNASFYIWDFGDNSPISNDPVVKHKYDPTMPGKYKVSLIVSNSATNMSCSDTAVTWIDFPEEVIYYIPNTFTPNGDEFNNTFQPIFSSGYDPQNYSFIVFDRWGQIVFESNNPTVGWDGTFGDQVLGNDTFVWKLGFKEKANDNEHYSTGHVNLVK